MCNNSVQVYQKQFHHLVDADFSTVQAEAIMRVIEERQVKALGELATKRDLEDLRVATQADIALVRTELKHEIAEVRTELKHEIAEVRSELKHEIVLLESKLTHRMTLGFIAVGALSLASPHLPEIISFITSMMK